MSCCAQVVSQLSADHSDAQLFWNGGSGAAAGTTRGVPDP